MPRPSQQAPDNANDRCIRASLRPTSRPLSARPTVPILTQDTLASCPPSAEEIDLVPQGPFGALEDTTWSTQELALEAGDRMLFLTDGMLERNAEGLDISALMLACAHLHPREAIQQLTHAVLEAAGGELKDDATSLA